MATKYLRSSAAGSADGSSWTNAYTSFVTAANALGAGDTLLVANDHSEAVGSDQTIVFTNSTLAAPCMAISVDPADDSYSAGAFFSTTGNFNITLNGYFLSDGINYSVGVGASTLRTLSILTSTTRSAIIRNATLTTPNVNNSRVSGGINGGVLIFDNVTLATAINTSWIGCGSHFIWKNSTCYSGTAPTQLMSSGSSGTIFFDGCDVSNVATVRPTQTGLSAHVTLTNCKVHTNMVALSANNARADKVTLINCASSGGSLRNETHDYSGAATISTAIYRTGGASDETASYSNRVAVAASGASSGASRYWPAYSLDLAFHVATADVGVSKTLTAYLLSTNAAGSSGVTLGATEAWIEVDYLGDSGSLDSTLASSGPANSKVAGAAPSADAVSAWTSTGLTSPVKQSVSTTFTPARAGMHRARIAIARVDTQTFVDPKMVLS